MPRSLSGRVPFVDTRKPRRIAVAKKQHEARVAQRRIMHQTAISGTFDPAATMEREEELRRDLARFEREHEETLARIRRGE